MESEDCFGKLTTESVKDFDSEVVNTTVLDNFEGPLDLLLYLINKEEIAIEDIFVSQVTEQFLTYMQGLPYLDMEKASEYLNIAATIIDIKARSLVPPVEDYFDEDDYGYEEDPKDALIRALNEYKMIKEEADKLKERETVGYFFKAPDKDIGELAGEIQGFHAGRACGRVYETDAQTRKRTGKRAAAERNSARSVYGTRQNTLHPRRFPREREREFRRFIRAARAEIGNRSHVSGAARAFKTSVSDGGTRRFVYADYDKKK